MSIRAIGDRSKSNIRYALVPSCEFKKSKSGTESRKRIVAQAVIEEVRRQHRTYVFTYQDRYGQRNRVGSINNKGWRAGRRRAAARYQETLERECPAGFRSVRVHDLRHTFGRRLRAAGVGLEDRQDLLGHKSSRV